MDNLSDARILLLARKSSSTLILRTIFNIAGVKKVTIVDEPHLAIELLRHEHFTAVFMEGAHDFDGMPFALAARRLPALLNPMIPMFAVFPQARKRDVETARDLGVHDVICRPLSPKTVMSKLRAVLTEPRPFIAAPSFFGPDRRSKARADIPRPPGRERRSRIAKKTKIAVTLI
jgi:two-component system chemotaxis response regulator CheY